MLRFLLVAAVVNSILSNVAFGYLGGFEELSDGYRPIINSANSFDVATYNAGQYGTVVGGGSYALDLSDLTAGPNELWTRLQGAPNPNFSFPYSYATGHKRYDRTYVNAGGSGRINTPMGTRQDRFDNQALVITTNSAGWNAAPRQYSYRTDQYDFGTLTASGASIPTASPSNSTIDVSFWSCAQIFGTAEGGGLGANTIGNKMSFFDSNGVLGFEIGYVQPGTSTDNIWYRSGATGSSGLDTGIVNPAVNRYYRWDLSIDTANDTVDIDFNGSNLIRNAPLIGDMIDLAELQFTSTGGVNNEKRWSVDDFTFCVSEAPLSELLGGGTLCSGDKEFSDFEYHGGGDMPAADDIYVKAITDADGNFGIRFQGAFIDGVGGGASDALIDYKVTAPDGKLIKDVHMAANPLVIGGEDGFVGITETFLPDNDETVLSVYDIPGVTRRLTDWADLVHERVDPHYPDEADPNNLAPVQELHVQKDILLWSQEVGSVATLSFIEQTFSQCDDLNRDGRCDLVPGDIDPNDGGLDPNDVFPDPNDFPVQIVIGGDFNLDGNVDISDFLAWQRDPSLGDLADWEANYGSVVSTNAASVPEPSSFVLFFAAVSVLPRRRTRLAPHASKPWSRLHTLR